MHMLTKGLYYLSKKKFYTKTYTHVKYLKKNIDYSSLIYNHKSHDL